MEKTPGEVKKVEKEVLGFTLRQKGSTEPYHLPPASTYLTGFASEAYGA